MRNGRRAAWLARAGPWIGAIAMVAAAPGPARAGQSPGAASGGGPTVRMTVEVDWSGPGPLAVELEATEGRVVGVTPMPPLPATAELGSAAGGPWRVATARSGRARARVEAPIGASLTVRAGGQVVRFPLARLIEGPQRTVPPAAVEVGVARVPWDAIEVDPGAGDGVAGPGAKVPLRLGFNVLGADAPEVSLRYVVELKGKGGAVAWSIDETVVVPTNTMAAPSWILSVPAPAAEGLYAVDVRATWEPAPAEGSRAVRFLRRRRPATGTSGTATRRLSMAVVDPKGRAVAEKPGRSPAEERVVDVDDLSRPRGHRPSASGRSPGRPESFGWPIPEAALVEETRRNRLLSRFAPPVDAEPVALAPADATGLAWSALALKVPRPDRPHRLTLSVAGGHPSALGVGLIAPGVAGGRARVVLDACVSGPPLIEGGRPQEYSWIVWPESAEPVLVLFNRNGTSPVQPGAVRLVELNDLPAPSIVAPGEATPRVVGVDLSGPSALDRFGGGGDPTVAGRNLARYLAHSGASAAVLPDTMADRDRRRSLDGQGDEDGLGPDRLGLLLGLLGRQGISAWVDLSPDAPLPGLPPAGSPEAMARGIVRVDKAGAAAGPAYLPIHPEVRRAMAARASSVARSYPGLSGVLIRLGPGSTLLGRPDSGPDDGTFARFVAAMFDPGAARSIPGQGAADPGRFGARSAFLEGAGQKPWLAWRCRELASAYAELAAAVGQSAPGARLAVATPDLDAGEVGEDLRRLDRQGLGPARAWRSFGLDLADWPAGDSAPVVLRGAGLSAEGLARDLATSPELDEPVAARSGRGLWLSTSSRPGPVGPEPALSAVALPDASAADEPLGHALAALDARWFFAAAEAVSGREERVRRFARTARSLPAPPASPAGPRPPSGVAARLTRAGPSAYLALSNDTPYPIRLETTVRCPAGTGLVDLGPDSPLIAEAVAGGLKVVADLPPFSVASARLDAASAEVESAVPRPGPAVLDGMKAQFDDLRVALARLNRPGSPAVAVAGPGPANPDFEAGGRGAPGVVGWRATGDPSASVALDPDRAHGGRSALRLDGATLPASAASDPFGPAGASPLEIQAWLRADRPDARVRLWLEGQAAGRPFARQLEVPAGPKWAATAVRASGIPEPGLESARLRFELLTPGRLWVDDLAVTPDHLEAERHARRDLLAALTAYGDGRYADFARLAGSHWARQVTSEAAATSGRVAVDRSGQLRTGDVGPAPPSALPTPRRLR